MQNLNDLYQECGIEKAHMIGHGRYTGHVYSECMQRYCVERSQYGFIDTPSDITRKIMNWDFPCKKPAACQPLSSTGAPLP